MLITVGFLGLLASLDPLRPVVFVMVLQTQRARVNAIAFFVGWALALAVLFSAGLIAFNAGSDRPSASQRTWLSIVELVLAAALLGMSARRWRTRNNAAPHAHPPAPIRRQLERLTPRRSGLLGVLIQPRTMTIAAAVVVARDRSGFVSAAAGLGIFALLSTGALLALFTYFVRSPTVAERRLAGVAKRIEDAGPILLTIACALGGIYLLFDGLRGLIAG